MKKIALLILLVFTLAGFAQKAETRKKSVTWKINNLKTISGNKLTVLGNPQIIKTDDGKAILFDGVDDGIFLETNPIAGASEFTIEAVFRPEAGGGAE